MGIVRRPSRRTLWRAVVVAVSAVAAAQIVRERPSNHLLAAGSQPSPVPAQGPALEAQARKTCGTCHAFPPPDILPKDEWRDEFVRMMFIREGRTPPIGPPGVAYKNVQLPPDMEQVLPFYTSHAPSRLPTPEAWPEPGKAPLSFIRRQLSVPGMPGTPAVSHVRLIDFDGDGQLDILGTDMRQGLVFKGSPTAASGGLAEVTSIPHPAHVTLADVDKDGLQDLLVAEMGEFFPADHDKGAAIWMRALASGKYGAFWLDGWPRVARIEAADFNGDGRPDLAVAAFGWRKSGRVSVLENRSPSAMKPDFHEHVVDKRAGGIAALPVDFNRDGRMDLVTLMAQEHESIYAYINTGAGGFSFEQKVIYAAPHPNWGSSGLELVDLDKDGDLDVLLTHGDTFDDGLVKPYHGIQWLENRGGFPFVEHTIAQMPGVHRAQAADLDGDGDLDVVASALLAGGSDVDEKVLPALAWLEQIAPGRFTRHTIEMGFPRHATLDLGDIDRDGDIDIAVGNFSIGPAVKAWVDIWVNQRK